MEDLPIEEYSRRLRETRSRMEKEGIDALFVYSDEYRPGYGMYFTNHKTINIIEECAQIVFIPLKGQPVVFTGSLNTFAAKRYSWVKDVREVDKLAHHLKQICKEVSSPPEKVGIVGEDILPIKIYRSMREGLGDVEVVNAKDLVDQQKAVKSGAEVSLMEKVARIGDKSISAVLKNLEPGKSEMELCGIAEHSVRSNGAELGCAFLIVSGPHTNFPTWRPSQRCVEPDDIVWIDVNPAYKGYNADVAITVPVQKANLEQKKALQFTKETLQTMVNTIKPGITGKQLYQTILQRAKDAGYEKYFTPYASGMRAIGHGVGLDVVEYPDLSPSSEVKFVPGMTLGLKFDLHGFSWGGVRMETTVVVADSGARSLNELPFAILIE